MNLATIAPGSQFGSLTVLRRIFSQRKQGARYQCRCACGKKLAFKQSKLSQGTATSCRNCAQKP